MAAAPVINPATSVTGSFILDFIHYLPGVPSNVALSLDGFREGAPGRPQKLKRDRADNKVLFPIRQSARTAPGNATRDGDGPGGCARAASGQTAADQDSPFMNRVVALASPEALRVAPTVALSDEITP